MTTKEDEKEGVVEMFTRLTLSEAKSPTCGEREHAKENGSLHKPNVKAEKIEKAKDQFWEKVRAMPHTC